MSLEKKESLNEKLLQYHCSICLENIEKGRNISIPPCDCREIVYHMECYYKWIEKNPTCPTCRVDIKVLNTDSENNDEEPGNIIDEDEDLSSELDIEDVEELQRQFETLVQNGSSNNDIQRRFRNRDRRSFLVALRDMRNETNTNQAEDSANGQRCGHFFFFVFLLYLIITYSLEGW